MPYLALSLIVIALFSPLLWVIKPHRFKHSGWLAAIAPASVTLWSITQIGSVAAGNFATERYSWIPSLGLELSLHLDGLALFFGLIVVGIGTAVAIYTGYYFEGDERQGYFYSLLFLFMASMLGLVWSDNLLCLFVFWEGTSITSYLLIAFKTSSKEAKEGGRRALIVTGVGGLAMLAGMVLLGQATGSYTISAILTTPGLTELPVYSAAFLLLALGAFTKSAQFPFHFWLPGAMSAPTPASAYLHSATMVKAGVFLLARLHPALSDSPLWFWTLLLIGGATMVLGALSALRYTDLKQVLAFATVSQLGALVLLLALPSEKATIAVVVGVLAHGLYKGPLFLIAGIVDHATGTRDLNKLAGLARQMPLLAGTTALASLSMAGIPPLFGFLAKETLLESFFKLMDKGMSSVGWLGVAAIVVTGMALMAAGLTLLWEPFWRKASALKHPAHVHHAPSVWFVLPPLVLTLLGTAAPFSLGLIEKTLLAAPASAIYGAPVDVHLQLWHGLTPTLMASLFALAAGALLFSVRDSVRRLFNRTPAQLNGIVLFNQLNDWLYTFAKWLTRTVQGGTMASQASVTLLAGAAVAIAGLLQIDWVQEFVIDWSQGPLLQEWIMAALAIVAAVATVRARDRLSAIISLGVVGVTVTLFFLFFSAPDLALTQLLIEVLTVVLLILVFFRVKPDTLPPLPLRRQVFNVIVALAMGLFGFTLVFLSAGIQSGEAIFPYFVQFSAPYGKGGNIVNVILVDFRGYDTLGEITVLAIAAIGGFALLRSPRLQALRSGLAARLAAKAKEEGKEA